MISIVISIRPEWACKILNGEKKIEVRKGLALYNALKKAEERGEEVEFLMYVTKAKPCLYYDYFFNRLLLNNIKWNDEVDFHKFNGKVVARFKAKAEAIKHKYLRNYDDWGGYYIDRGEKVDIREEELGYLSCLDHKQLDAYLQGKQGTALEIRDLEIFDKPKTLADYGLKRAPESWCYTKEAK